MNQLTKKNGLMQACKIDSTKKRWNENKITIHFPIALYHSP